MLLRDFIPRVGANFPGKLAFIDGERRATWQDLDERSDRFAAVLQGLGISKGDRVAILSLEYLEVMEHWFACLKIGAVRTGINWRYSQREMLHILDDCRPKAILIDAQCQPLLAGHLEEIASRGVALIGYGGAHDLPHDYDSLMRAANQKPVLPPLADSDLAMISYTSGTTGLPKGAMLTQRGVREALVHTALALGIRQDDVFFMPGATPGVPILLDCFGLVTGATTVLPNGQFEPRRFLESIEREGVTYTGGVPTMLLRILEVKRATSFDTSSLRAICYGSSPATPGLIRALIDEFDCELIQFYGLTETTGGWLTFLRHRDHLRALREQESLLTSCGQAAPHVEVGIFGAEGKRLPAQEVGEVWVRGDITTPGYLNRPEDAADLYWNDWLRTHDLGKMDEQGYLYLTDRKKFLIITGAFNVYPVVVENVLSEHPAVHEVAVIGAPHPEWGEAVVAAVTLVPGTTATPQELIDFCRDKVGKWEVPKFVDIVDELPKGSTNKLAKHTVRDWYRNDPSRLPWGAT